MKSRFFEIQIAEYDLLTPLSEVKREHPEIEKYYRARGENGKYMVGLYLKKACELSEVAEWFSDEDFSAVPTKLKDRPKLNRFELVRRLEKYQMSMTIQFFCRDIPGVINGIIVKKMRDRHECRPASGGYTGNVHEIYDNQGVGVYPSRQRRYQTSLSHNAVLRARERAGGADSEVV